MSKNEFLGLSMAVLGIGVWLGGSISVAIHPIAPVLVSGVLLIGGFVAIGETRAKMRKAIEVLIRRS